MTLSSSSWTLTASSELPSFYPCMHLSHLSLGEALPSEKAAVLLVSDLPDVQVAFAGLASQTLTMQPQSRCPLGSSSG